MHSFVSFSIKNFDNISNNFQVVWEKSNKDAIGMLMFLSFLNDIFKIHCVRQLAPSSGLELRKGFRFRDHSVNLRTFYRLVIQISAVNFMVARVFITFLSGALKWKPMWKNCKPNPPVSMLDRSLLRFVAIKKGNGYIW